MPYGPQQAVTSGILTAERRPTDPLVSGSGQTVRRGSVPRSRLIGR